jgi:anaerobic sulfite reductase subunit B
MTTTMAPSRYRVVRHLRETADTVTLALEPVDGPLPTFLPGQFAMVYAFGIGEIPISVSGRYDTGGLVHTIRDVGAVSKALCDSPVGRVLGVRGPFGRPWGLPAHAGADVVIVAGGLGLAPLRPVVRHAVNHRGRYRSVTLLIGARTPADLLYPGEYDAWRAGGVEIQVTVDRADRDWTGQVGVVTTLFDRLAVEPAQCAAYLCGPEIMMRFAARGLAALGVAPEQVEVSLERNMRCGIGHCGHCQLGPLLVCRDGPVVDYAVAGPLLTVREL